MKLLMATHYFDSHPGGIERVAKNLFRGLAGPDCEIKWAAAAVSEAPASTVYSSALPLETWNGVEKALGVPFPVPSAGALKRLFKTVRASDVVLLHDCLYLSNMAAFWYARRRGIPVVIIQHIGMVPYSNILLRTVMKLGNSVVTRRMLSKAQQVVFISETTERQFASLRFRRPPAVIFNGVDTETFRPLAEGEQRAEIRDRLGLPRDRPVALFVGRFVAKKGLAVLRHAALLQPSITWAFAGAGPLDPQKWNFDNVRVYSELRGAGLAELYRASDVFVLPSTGEGFPLVMQEALACGLPVVCSAENATADAALAPFVRGVSLSAGDDRQSAEDFLAAIGEVLSEGFTAEDAQRRYRFAQTRYCWKGAVAQYLGVLKDLVVPRDHDAATVLCGNSIDE